MSEENSVENENCTDATRREAYLEALKAKIGVESAKAAMDKKVGEFRNILKKYKKLGVNTEAVTYALAVRMEDPDEVFIRERERLKLLDVSGFLPGIKDRLMERLDVEEATSNEDHTLNLARAHDLGAQSGRAGITRDANPYQAGSEHFVHWLQGWLSGQRAIADEMEQQAIAQGGTAKPLPKAKRGRPPTRALVEDNEATVVLADEETAPE
jgi:ribosome modulation factor